jgi:hypothetical protein
MNNNTQLDAATETMKCTKCAQPMRLSYRETFQPGGQLKVYECHACRMTTTVAMPERA